MTFRFSRRILFLITCITFASGGFSQNGSAQEYRIGASDVIEIGFWQDERLNSTVRVNEDGRITLDIVGEIEAAGKTTTELQDEIVRKISRLNKDISQAVVRVIEYNYNYVYVSGQVKRSGKLTFERIPDLWTIINEAGGITNQSDLTRVSVIKGGEKAGKVEFVNLSEMIANGQLGDLPVIERGDAIDIPMTPSGLPTGDLAQSSGLKNLVYVVGEVGRPGPVRFEGNMDVLELLALAGGPGPDADLSKTKIISGDGIYAQTLTFDLEKYSRTGRPARYLLRQEDTFVVPRKGGGFLSGLSAGAIAGLLTSIGSLVFIIGR